MPEYIQGVRTAKTSVGTSPTQLAQFGSKTAVIKVPSGGATVFIGDLNVTTASGFPLAAGESLSLEINLSDGAVYGIVASGSQDVHIIGGS